LREDLRAKVKLNKPLTMVATYRNACARETIAIAERNIAKASSFKSYVPSVSQQGSSVSKQFKEKS